MTNKPKCPYCGSEDTIPMWCFYVGVKLRCVYKCRKCGRTFSTGG